jgi:threonine dehydrogenase-like Zn-dependent dehydrogenase
VPVRALVIIGPGQALVQDVDPAEAAPGQVVVDVERVGLCGTDVEFFTGHMSYLHSGEATYPIRIGHEWSAVVSAVGPGVDAGWLGRRVTGDTMLGCGHCARCRSGRHHVCAERYEIGVRRGFPGALAEQLAVPVTALHPLPDTVDATLGALVEPGGNALRAFRAAEVRAG